VLDWVPTVDIKIDPKQATFKFPKELLTLARSILYKRYVDFIGKVDEFNVEWTEQYDEGDPKPARVDLSLEETLTQQLPKSFLQSRIQVFHVEKQKLLVTITIYTTGTVLVQGVQCQKWLRNEFDTLIYVVRTIYHLLHRGADGDSVRMAVQDDVSCMAVPSVTYRGKRGVFIDGPVTPRRDMATTHLMLSHEGQASTNPESTPSTPDSEQQSPPSPSSTPEGADHSSSVPSDREVQTEINNTLTSTDHSPSPHSTPKVVKTKNRVNQRAAIESLQQQVAGLATLVTDGVGEIKSLSLSARSSNAALEQQVASLTSELASLRAALANRDTSIPPVSTTTASTQTDIDEETDIECAIALSNRYALLQELENSDEGGKKDGGESAKKVESDKDERVEVAKETSQQTVETHPPPQPHSMPRSGVIEHTVPVDLSVNTDQAVTVETPPLSPPSSVETQKLEPKADTSNVQRSPHSPSPRQKLAALKVKSDTTHLLLGDSVVREVKANLLFRTEASENLSVSGLTVEDLQNWLTDQPRYHTVSYVVAHIGVNSCKRHIVKETQWCSLIQSLKKVFPKATVRMSSIVPLWGGHHGSTKKTVEMANQNLRAACDRHQVAYIDQAATFTANSGAPRLDLYCKDGLHPSGLGVARLANAIKYFGSKDNSQQSRANQQQSSTAWRSKEDPAQQYTGRPVVNQPLLGHAPTSYAERTRSSADDRCPSPQYNGPIIMNRDNFPHLLGNANTTYSPDNQRTYPKGHPFSPEKAQILTTLISLLSH
jgi:lysophospholipase L1-like esterase